MIPIFKKHDKICVITAILGEHVITIVNLTSISITSHDIKKKSAMKIVLRNRSIEGESVSVLRRYIVNVLCHRHDVHAYARASYAVIG